MLKKPYKGDENYIFISYAHKDIKDVRSLIEQLQDNGFNVWYDEGIDPGTEWDENIASHIKDCSYFIAYMTNNYLESQNCRDEINYARDLDKERLLIYGEDVELPEGMKMRLGRLQAIYKNKYSNEKDFLGKVFETRGLDACRSSSCGQRAQTAAEAPASAGAGERPPEKKGPNLKVILIAAAVLIAAVIGFFALSNKGATDGPYNRTEVQNGALGDKPAINYVEGEQEFLFSKEAVNNGAAYQGDDVVIQGEKGFWILAQVKNDNPDSTVIAEDVRIKFEINKVSDTEYEVSAYLTSSNAEPYKLEDTIRFTSSEKFDLQYVTGSSQVYSHFVDGSQQNTMRADGDAVYGDGVLLGYDTTDGKIPGGEHVTISIEVRVVR